MALDWWQQLPVRRVVGDTVPRSLLARLLALVVVLLGVAAFALVLLAIVRLLVPADRNGVRFGSISPRGLDSELSRRPEDIALVGFWAAWCLPCEGVPEVLDGLAQRYAARGVAVFAVALDDFENADVSGWRQGHPRSPLHFLVSDAREADGALLAFGVGDRSLPLFRIRDRRDCSEREVASESDWPAVLADLLERRLHVEIPAQSVASCQGRSDQPEIRNPESR